MLSMPPSTAKPKKDVSETVRYILSQISVAKLFSERWYVFGLGRHLRICSGGACGRDSSYDLTNFKRASVDNLDFAPRHGKVFSVKHPYLYLRQLAAD